MKLLALLFILNLHADETKNGLERYEEARMRDDQRCDLLKEGDSVNRGTMSPIASAATNGYGTQMNYIVTRKGNTYQIVFPIVFETNADYDLPTPVGISRDGRNRYADQKFRTWANGCLKTLSKNMPVVDGINISLSLDATADLARGHGMGMPPKTVQLRSKDYRSDTGNFETDISCGELGHELMHHMGLPDTYAEDSTEVTGLQRDRHGQIIPHQRRPVKTFDSDCRVPAVRPNIMAAAVLYDPDQKIYSVLGACNCKTPPCEAGRDIKKAFSNGMVIGTTAQCPGDYSLDTGYEGNYYTEKQRLAITGTDPAKQYFIFKEIPKPPMLSPAQARHLIYPGCLRKNRRFYNCSASAYDTSTEQGCGLLQQSCRKDDTWMD